MFEIVIWSDDRVVRVNVLVVRRKQRDDARRLFTDSPKGKRSKARPTSSSTISSKYYGVTYHLFAMPQAVTSAIDVSRAVHERVQSAALCCR